MSYDAYICYDEQDKGACDAVCQLFDDNNISYWVKSKHFSSGDSVDKITNAIEDSKHFVLIYSKHSQLSNFVVTETDIAFSRNIPLVVFKIDDSKSTGHLEFILENQKVIPSFPYPKKQLTKLVKEISSNPVSRVKIDSKSLRVFDKSNPQRKESKIKIYITLAIPIVIALILIYFFLIVPTGQHTTEDGVFAMNVTDVDVGQSNGFYKYTVFGESYNLPSDSERYFMNIQFFDKDENMVYEVNSTADEFKSGVICRCELDNDNVTHVGFKLTDLNGNLLSKQNYIMN